MEKILHDIIQGITCTIKGDVNIRIGELVFDSRQVKQGDLFVAFRGTKVDGHDFILKAIELGATAVVCEKEIVNIPSSIIQVRVKDSLAILGLLASNFYGNPARELIISGVTGTNGKTSIATLLHRMFTEFGYKAGLLSTVRNLIGEKEVAATHTTPDAISLHKLLRDMVDAGCTHLFMEVSSHALDQFRTIGLDFKVAIFTNLTHDHLDYHKTFDSYLRAKKILFDGLSADSFALMNFDDKNGKVMVQNTKSKVKSYGLRTITDFKAKIIESHFDGMLMQVDGNELWTKLIGEFNAYNLLAVYGTAVLLGLPVNEVLRVVSNLSTVEGRFEYVRSNTGITAIIDYAHTPDALKNVIDTINQIRNPEHQLISVFGAGGDRDKTKRPVMGQIVSDYSTKTIITSDNPRSEEPQTIIDDIMAGVPIDKKRNVLAIADRKEAIRTACMLAMPGDVILIAGKGHENYQEIKGVKSHFSDKEVVSDLFLTNNINLQ